MPTKSEQMQNESISFFKNEKEKEIVSSWVYAFHFMRYIFNTRNFATVLLLAIVYTFGSLTIQSIRENWAESKVQAIKDEAQQITNIKQIFAKTIKFQEKSNYLNLTQQAEKDIAELFLEHKNLLIKNMQQGRDLNFELRRSNDTESEILTQIAEDKKLFTLVLDSAKLDNHTIHSLKYDDIQNSYQRLELYQTKNYHMLFMSNYSKFLSAVTALK